MCHAAAQIVGHGVADQLVRVLGLQRLDARPVGQPARRSSSATGTPNTAFTASPMNFSTVPPCDSTIAFIRPK